MGAVVCAGPPQRGRQARNNHVLTPSISIPDRPEGPLTAMPAILLAQPPTDAWTYANLRADSGDAQTAESQLADPLLPKLRAIPWNHDLRNERLRIGRRRSLEQ